MLDPELLAAADTAEIARLIVPSRFYSQAESGSAVCPGLCLSLGLIQ